MAALRWIVALSKPNQEAIAVLNLERQGFEVYCPKFKETRLNKPSVIKPLFPRYLFIGIDQTWYSITGTRGISHVLMGSLGPRFMNPTEIRKLRDREYGGLVSLAPKERFERGAAVKATDGPLMGMQLLYEGMTAKDRCAVLAQMLGGYVKVELDEKSLVAA